MAVEADLPQLLFGAVRVILGILNGEADGVIAARDEPDHQTGVNGKGRRTFRCIDDAEPAAGAGADIKQAPARLQPRGNPVDGVGDSAGRLPDSLGTPAVFLVDEAHHLDGRYTVELHGGGIAPLGPQRSDPLQKCFIHAASLLHCYNIFCHQV